MSASAVHPESGAWRIVPLESDHFGLRIARLVTDRPSGIAQLLAECRQDSVELAVLRSPADRLDIAHAAEAAGAHLMDVMVYLRADFDRVPAKAGSSSGFALDRFAPQDRDGIIAAAADAFTGYRGHYHTDSRIPRERADTMYTNWARDCCDGRYGPTDIFVARDDEGRVAGFVAAEPVPERGTNVAIGGMAAWAQGRGGYRDLMLHSRHWLMEHRGACWGEYSTQITNVAAQRSVIELGYRPHHAAFTFHAWLR